MGKFHYRDPSENELDPFAPVENSSNEFEALLEQETKKNVTAKSWKPGEAAEGSVLRVNPEFIFVDLGGKNAAVLPTDEYRMAHAGDLPRPGQELKAFVKKDNGSEILLSLSVSRGEADSQALRQAFDTELPVEAKIEKVIKGGFEASVGKKRAFVPFSQMEIGSITEPETYVGSVHRFRITEFSQGGRNIVLSRKALLIEERQQQAQALLANLTVGQTLKVTVMRMAPIGAFVDLGGVDGLIPLSELSWKRIKRPEDVVKVGEVVDARVIRLEKEPRLRIALSIKDAPETGGVPGQNPQESSQAPISKPGLSGLMTGAFADAFEKAKRREK